MALRQQPPRQCKEYKSYAPAFDDNMVQFDFTFGKTVKVGSILKIINPTVPQSLQPFVVLTRFDTDYGTRKVPADFIWDLPAYIVQHLDIQKYMQTSEIHFCDNLDGGNISKKNFIVALHVDADKLCIPIYFV